jgi:predicted ester cyclase
MSDRLIRAYYACFNERRISDAGELFSEDAVLDFPPFASKEGGAAAYAHFVETWLHAFPDAQLKIEHVEQRGDTICEVDLLASGTHEGPLDLGGHVVLKPSHARLSLKLRELLEIRGGKITYASLRFDLNHLIRQLVQVDYAKLRGHLETLRHLTDELRDVKGDAEQLRDLTERIGQTLDEARRVVRPYFNR